MRVLFLDLETTGLKPEKALVWQTVFAKAVKQDNTLKVIEVAELVGEECVQNMEVKEALQWAELLVAHNTDFEEKFLRHRRLPVPKESFCTMRQATPVCQIPNPWYTDDRGNIKEWMSPYKWPRLSEAIEILGLEDQLKKLVKGLAFHDALCDIYATMLLYAKLEKLQLEIDHYKIRRASPLRKYLTVRKYAVVGKEELLRSIASQSALLRALDNLLERFRRWQWRRNTEDLPF